jgi:penicillin-binding protein 1A
MSWLSSVLKQISLRFWIAYAIVVVGIAVFFTCVANGVFGPLPSLRDLENPQTAVATEVISADGVVLGKYFHENRTNIEMPVFMTIPVSTSGR